MLLFITFFLTSLLLTILLIKTTRWLDERRSRQGETKVDQMVGEEMKWGERREVVEWRVIGGREADMGAGSRLKRQARGNLAVSNGGDASGAIGTKVGKSGNVIKKKK